MENVLKSLNVEDLKKLIGIAEDTIVEKTLESMESLLDEPEEVSLEENLVEEASLKKVVEKKTISFAVSPERYDLINAVLEQQRELTGEKTPKQDFYHDTFFSGMDKKSSEANYKLLMKARAGIE